MLRRRGVCMLRQTRRGETVTVLRSDWYIGDGRSTKCSPWQSAPDIVVTSNRSLHAGAPGWPLVIPTGEFIERMEPQVETAVEASALREPCESADLFCDASASIRLY